MSRIKLVGAQGANNGVGVGVGCDALAGTAGGGNNGGQASGACDMRKSPHIPGVQSTTNIAQSVSYHSTGGTTMYVPTGLIAESFHRMDRSSLRGLMEESTPSRCATRVIIEDAR